MENFMKRAIELAKLGEGRVSPNPLVGAVLVKNGVIVAEGYHQYYGGPHAEVNTISNANISFEDVTMYVTLEPCCHYGKTPPCTDLIISTGIRNIAVGTLDPNPLVSGKGIEKLRKHGINVTVGILEEECRSINEIFNNYITNKVPFVYLKGGISLDGKIALSNGMSKWITSIKMRNESMKLRNKVTGIMVGINTVLNDNPSLTCRIKNGINPVRIIVDSNLKIPLDANVVSDKDYKDTIIATTVNCDKDKKEKLKEKGIRIIVTKENINGQVSLNELIKELGLLNIDSILIEGGGTLNFTALEAGIVNKLVLYVAPKIIGGHDSLTFVGGNGVKDINRAINLKNIKASNFDNGLYIECEVDKCSQE